MDRYSGGWEHALGLSTRGRCHHCESSDPTEASTDATRGLDRDAAFSLRARDHLTKAVFVKVTLDGILRTAERRQDGDAAKVLGGSGEGQFRRTGPPSDHKLMV